MSWKSMPVLKSSFRNIQSETKYIKQMSLKFMRIVAKQEWNISGKKANAYERALSILQERIYQATVEFWHQIPKHFFVNSCRLDSITFFVLETLQRVF